MFASGQADTTSQPSRLAASSSFWKLCRTGVIQRYSHAVVCDMDAHPVRRRTAIVAKTASLVFMSRTYQNLHERYHDFVKSHMTCNAT